MPLLLRGCASRTSCALGQRTRRRSCALLGSSFGVTCTRLHTHAGVPRKGPIGVRLQLYGQCQQRACGKLWHAQTRGARAHPTGTGRSCTCATALITIQLCSWASRSHVGGAGAVGLRGYSRHLPSTHQLATARARAAPSMSPCTARLGVHGALVSGWIRESARARAHRPGGDPRASPATA